MREFNHRCAICGADRPQIHHLDENPGNNEPSNLLPLCPNCRLSDQHDPTAGLPTPILKVFRTYKDPVILSPQFVPLFKRLSYLDEISDSTKPNELEQAGHILVSFVMALKMGAFYGEQIAALIKRPAYASVFSLDGTPTAATARAMAEHPIEYRRQLCGVRDQVFELAIELLRYQDWPAGPQQPMGR